MDMLRCYQILRRLLSLSWFMPLLMVGNGVVFWLFARNRNDNAVNKYRGKIYSFTFSQDGSPRLNFIPCVDDKGEPCMFDKATRQTFKNVGTGEFIAGVGTVGQLTALLFCPHSGAQANHAEGQTYTTGSAQRLRSGHILDLGTLSTDTDLTALSLAESGNVKTAELWFTTATTAPVITWPADAVCLDDSMPELVPSTAYRFALRREPNGKLIINLAYEYSL